MSNRVPVIGAIVAVVGLGLAGAWVLLDTPRADVRPQAASLTEVTDPAEIAKLVAIPRIGLATGENYLGHRIRYVIGRVKNITAEKSVGLVEVLLIFSDVQGNPIQKHVARAYDSADRRLGPGQEYEFQIGFEELPRNWNYRRPAIQVTRVGY